MPKTELTLEEWVESFRRDAHADKLASFRNHLQRLKLKSKPEEMLKATVNMVIATCAYLHIDGRSDSPFLKMQKYDPGESKAKYMYTFDICGKAYARLLDTAALKYIDLADLYDYPWNDYKMCGYFSILVTRTDRKPLTRREILRLENAVKEDLFFDFSEDEIWVEFDPDYVSGSLFVMVQDCDMEEL